MNGAEFVSFDRFKVGGIEEYFVKGDFCFGGCGDRDVV